MATKLYLGKVRVDFKSSTVAGEQLYLSKHSWDCDWYWGMGYIGNKDLHTHFDITFFKEGWETDVTKVFIETKITQDDWWNLLELFKTAYTLREVADTYHRGGSHIATNNFLDKDLELSARLNKDLEKVLDGIWTLLTEINSRG